MNWASLSGLPWCRDLGLSALLLLLNQGKQAQMNTLPPTPIIFLSCQFSWGAGARVNNYLFSEWEGERR